MKHNMQYLKRKNIKTSKAFMILNNYSRNVKMTYLMAMRMMRFIVTAKAKKDNRF